MLCAAMQPKKWHHAYLIKNKQYQYFEFWNCMIVVDFRRRHWYQNLTIRDFWWIFYVWVQCKTVDKISADHRDCWLGCWWAQGACECGGQLSNTRWPGGQRKWRQHVLYLDCQWPAAVHGVLSTDVARYGGLLAHEGNWQGWLTTVIMSISF